MLPGIPESVEYVQKSDDSRNSAIRIAYRNSLRPSSLPEPRHSSLKFSIGYKLCRPCNIYYKYTHTQTQKNKKKESEKKRTGAGGSLREEE